MGFKLNSVTKILKQSIITLKMLIFFHAENEINQLKFKINYFFS